jgi:hypothetical protein
MSHREWFCKWKGSTVRTLQQDWGCGLQSIRDMKLVLKMGEVAIKAL